MTFMRPLINKIVGKRYKHYFFNRKSLILSNIKKNNLSTRIVSGSEIVYKIGLTNRGYFSRIFKERYEVSPSIFRKREDSPAGSEEEEAG